jgi:hypothetical protein
MSVTQTVSHHPTIFVRAMRVLYVILAWLFALCILIQVFLAGLSIFESPGLISLHIAFAHTFEFIPILLLITALLGRFPRSIPLFSLLLILQFALQYAFVQLSGQFSEPFVAAFHPVNAVVMFWVTLYVARRSTAVIARRT